MFLSKSLQTFTFHLFFSSLCYAYSDAEVTLGPQKDSEMKISEYYSAVINVTWTDPLRGISRVDSTETGRFSTAGPEEITGRLVVPLQVHHNKEVL